MLEEEVTDGGGVFGFVGVKAGGHVPVGQGEGILAHTMQGKASAVPWIGVGSIGGDGL